jgi:hypothetical protein
MDTDLDLAAAIGFIVVPAPGLGSVETLANVLRYDPAMSAGERALAVSAALLRRARQGQITFLGRTT